MRAAVLEQLGRDLVVREHPDPRAEDGEVVVAVRAAGLCGTDVKIADGAIPGIGLPLVLGHEIAGEVVDAAHGFQSGDRVAVYPLRSCGRCGSCRRGETEVCAAAIRIGFERDGGLAERVAVPAQDLVPIPEGVGLKQAAVAMDAVLTSLRAVRHQARVKRGDAVVVVGAGRLGLHGVQAAVAAGADVAVVDPLASHRELALELGSDIALEPAEAARGLASWRDEGADVALELSGSPDGFRAGVDALRAGGLIVCVGYRPGADFAIDSSRLALSELRIEGQRGGRIEHAREALEAVRSGEVKPLIDRVGELEEAGELLSAVRTGEVVGRVVAAP